MSEHDGGEERVSAERMDNRKSDGLKSIKRFDKKVRESFVMTIT